MEAKQGHRNKAKICALCGKQEKEHWSRHWKGKHPLQKPQELSAEEIPREPWCDNWKEIIASPDVAPINIRSSFMKKSKWELKRQAKSVAN